MCVSFPFFFSFVCMKSRENAVFIGVMYINRPFCACSTYDNFIEMWIWVKIDIRLGLKRCTRRGSRTCNWLGLEGASGQFFTVSNILSTLFKLAYDIHATPDFVAELSEGSSRNWRAWYVGSGFLEYLRGNYRKGLMCPIWYSKKSGHSYSPIVCDAYRFDSHSKPIPNRLAQPHHYTFSRWPAGDDPFNQTKVKDKLNPTLNSLHSYILISHAQTMFPMASSAKTSSVMDVLRGRKYRSQKDKAISSVIPRTPALARKSRSRLLDQGRTAKTDKKKADLKFVCAPRELLGPISMYLWSVSLYSSHTATRRDRHKFRPGHRGLYRSALGTNCVRASTNCTGKSERREKRGPFNFVGEVDCPHSHSILLINIALKVESRVFTELRRIGAGMGRVVVDNFQRFEFGTQGESREGAWHVDFGRIFNDDMCCTYYVKIFFFLELNPHSLFGDAEV